MPQGPDHIYFLMNEANESYYVTNGVVQVSSSPKPLQFSPDGWRNIQINNQRNPTYFALDRSFTVPLDYVKDGAQILRYLYYNRGIEEKVYMCIAKQSLSITATHYGYYYTLLYRGEVDFMNFKHDSPKVTVNIMEGGAVKYIKANQNTMYEFDMEDPETVRIRMDGVTLRQSANYLISNGDVTTDIGIHTMSATLINVEAITSIGAISQKRVRVANSYSGLTSTNEFILETGSQPAIITIDWNFNVLPQLASGIGAVFGTRIFLKAIEIGDNYLFTHDLQNKGGGDPNLLFNRTQNFSGSTTITVGAEKKLVLYMSANATPDFIFFSYQNNGSLNINYTYTHKVTFPLAYKPYTLLSKLIDKVTEGQFSIQSDLLMNQFPNIPLTCGDALREIAGAKIKTSLSQYFNSFNTALGIGLGMVGNTMRLEKKSDWVDYTNPIDLGEVSKFRCSPAQEYIFNYHKIGFPNQNYEDVNGRQEFNNTHEYLYPNTRVSKVFEQVSDYRADCYGAEFIRINLEGKSTTDNKGDNEIFMIHTLKAISAYYTLDSRPIYNLDRTLNVGATGLLEPARVFNLFLTPKHCLLRNGDYVHSLFYKQENKFIRFQTTEKNAAVVTDVIENADVEIANLPDPLFTPNLLEFESKVPINQQDILNQNPIKAFRFTVNGISFMGIPVKVSSRSADRASQEYQLLSAPTNDLTQLERYNG